MSGMPIAKQLIPIDLPQCEAVKQMLVSLKATSSKEQRCKVMARYEIDGHNYCCRHAGTAAIAILLNTSTVK